MKTILLSANSFWVVATSALLLGTTAFTPFPSLAIGIQKLATPNRNLLSKSTGVNYTQLHNLLAARKWREADQETFVTMIKATGLDPKESKVIEISATQSFPCEDLHIIDRLWSDASGGKFGFNTQSQIYIALKGSLVYDNEIYDTFSKQVGWELRGGTEIDAENNLDISQLPRGYYPRRIRAHISRLDSGLVELYSIFSTRCN